MGTAMEASEAKRLLRTSAGIPNSPLMRAIEEMCVEGLEACSTEKEAEFFIEEMKALLQYETVAEIWTPRDQRPLL
jgi:hypothetical protein